MRELARSVGEVEKAVEELVNPFEEVAQSIEDPARKWQEEMATFGMTSRQKQLFKIRQSLELSAEIQPLPQLPPPPAAPAAFGGPSIEPFGAFMGRLSSDVGVPRLEQPALPAVGPLNIPAGLDMPPLPDVGGVNVPVGFASAALAEPSGVDALCYARAPAGGASPDRRHSQLPHSAGDPTLPAGAARGRFR